MIQTFTRLDLQDKQLKLPVSILNSLHLYHIGQIYSLVCKQKMVDFSSCDLTVFRLIDDDNSVSEIR